MEIKFTVPGIPKGKQRPRVCRINGQSLTYTPKQTIEYERIIRASYSTVSKFKFQKNEPLEISILALFLIPKHVSKSVKELMILGKILPTKRPDCDNVLKAVLDGLNGVAYQDDAQICRIYFEKMYAEIPETRIIIKEINL